MSDETDAQEQWNGEQWNTCPIHGHYCHIGAPGDCPTCEELDAWCRAAGVLREGEIIYYFGGDDAVAQDASER